MADIRCIPIVKSFQNYSQLSKVLIINLLIILPLLKMYQSCAKLKRKENWSLMRWGLIPHGLILKKALLINARIETIDTKLSFRESIKCKRCLILANSFYEWRKLGLTKQPYYIYQNNGQPFALTGIWATGQAEKQVIKSCCIITLPINDHLQALHNRMPAMIKNEDYESWLDPKNNKWDNIKKLITDEPHKHLILPSFKYSK